MEARGVSDFAGTCSSRKRAPWPSKSRNARKAKPAGEPRSTASRWTAAGVPSSPKRPSASATAIAPPGCASAPNDQSRTFDRATLIERASFRRRACVAAQVQPIERRPRGVQLVHADEDLDGAAAQRAPVLGTYAHAREYLRARRIDA